MKKTSLFIAVASVALFGGALLINNSSNNLNTASAQVENVKTQHDLEKLKFAKTKLDVPTKPAIIDEKTAIENAKKAFSYFTKDAKEVTVEYHLMTNPEFELFSEEALAKNPKLKEKKHMDQLPVYIVSFKGLSQLTSAPAGSKGDMITENNIVVDAETGVALMGFSYR
ncbi:hypothetical protein [Effusibacillus consociatus]|uniref:PepSY domain-containing protein n=1 Tax=Effusibacillus consociatus TaxID=1117041 RepID=A0ABV9Q163_9BACL